MQFPPVRRPFFSEDPKRESFWTWFLLAAAAASTVILVAAWPQTRSVEFISTLQHWRVAPVEFIFRLFTFIGDDEFFMVFFSVLIWCYSKTLGFWGAFMLLSSAVYSNLIKDITLLERPPLEGVVHPEGSYAFPSGHTLTAVTVWGYLAVRVKKKALWIWAFVAVIVIGFSRLVLGYHFLGDVLGGIVFGIPFLLFFLWVSSLLAEKRLLEKFSVPLLLALSVIVPILLAAVLPGADPPKILGYICGASFGYILETNYVNFKVESTFLLQVLKVFIGVAVLFGIIVGLGGLLPSALAPLGFIRYALGGVWVTLGAPLLFVRLGFSKSVK